MDTLDLVPHRFDVDTYHAMIEAEILTKEDKVELLDGVIVEMSPESEEHHYVVSLLNRFLVRAIDDPLVVRPGGPLTMRPDSEPEPDLAITDWWKRGSGHPGWAHLVVEVSLSSLAKDRGRKAALYARHGIPEYWIFDLIAGQVVVHREPLEGVYSYTEIVRPPGPLQCRSVALPPLDLAPYFP